MNRHLNTPVCGQKRAHSCNRTVLMRLLPLPLILCLCSGCIVTPGYVVEEIPTATPVATETPVPQSATPEPEATQTTAPFQTSVPTDAAEPVTTEAATPAVPAATPLPGQSAYDARASLYGKDTDVPLSACNMKPETEEDFALLALYMESNNITSVTVELPDSIDVTDHSDVTVRKIEEIICSMHEQDSELILLRSPQFNLLQSIIGWTTVGSVDTPSVTWDAFTGRSYTLENSLHWFPEETDAQQVETEDRARQVVREVLSAMPYNATDREVAIALMRYLRDRVVYDWDAYEKYCANPDDNQVLNYPGSAHAALIGGKAVCQGYTLAYNMLLMLSGIPALDEDTAEQGTVNSHVWTVAILDGTVFHIDVTWFDDDFGDPPYEDWTYFTTDAVSFHKLDSHYVDEELDLSALRFYCDMTKSYPSK